TDKNVEFSDSVLIIQGDSMNNYSTRYTIDRAEELKKKLKIVNVFTSNLDEVVKWIVNNNICSLNISGARKSNLLGADLQVKMFYTLGPEGSFSYFTAQEIFQKISDECLLVPTKVNRVNMFEYNHLFERFKVKLEIETPV
ncbi:33887_t:CDS:2, partial [Racocetra persica]